MVVSGRAPGGRPAPARGARPPGVREPRAGAAGEGAGEGGKIAASGAARTAARAAPDAAGEAGRLPDLFHRPYRDRACGLLWWCFMGLRRDLPGLLPGGGLAWQRRTPGIRRSRIPPACTRTGGAPTHAGVHPHGGAFTRGGASMRGGAFTCSARPRVRRTRVCRHGRPPPARSGPGGGRVCRVCAVARGVVVPVIGPWPGPGWGPRRLPHPAAHAGRSACRERTTLRNDGAPRWSNRNARCARARH